MKEKGIHYRTGSKSSHCGCEILPDGNDILYIVIKSIEFKDIEEVAGKEKKQVWIATFAPNPYTNLPMILNATNRKRLAKLSKNNMINLLKDFPVRLCAEECRDVQDGGTTMGLRISKLPATAPKATAKDMPVQSKKILDETMVNDAIKFLETKSMEELEKYYDISAEIKTKLLKAKDNGQ